MSGDCSLHEDADTLLELSQALAAIEQFGVH